MRESAARRLLFATLFALLAGALVHFHNPVGHLKADLRADASGFRVSLEVARHALQVSLDR